MRDTWERRRFLRTLGENEKYLPSRSPSVRYPDPSLSYGKGW